MAFKGSLYTQQKPAAEKLVNKKRVLLAHEQGCGKTIIALAAAEKLLELNKAQRILIVCPTSIAWQWDKQIKAFTDSHSILTTREDKGSRTYKTQKKKYYRVVGYHLFRRDFDKLKKTKWDVVIYDECQEFKNANTVIRKKVLSLNRLVSPSYLWGLTGTGISTKLEELYSIFYVIDKNFLPSWKIFEKNHCVKNELGLVYGYKNLKAFHEYAQQRMDRKTHADFQGQLPAILPQTYQIPQSTAYKKAQKQLLGTLDNLVAHLKFDEEGSLLSERDPKVAKAFHAVINELYSRHKLDKCKELIDTILAENPDNRIVVFSTRKLPLYDLHKSHSKLATQFTGDQSQSEKRASIEAFQRDKRILLASNAAKAGLDLPFANYLIHLDIPPSFEVLDQRTKRITRANSHFGSVVVIYLVVMDSIEEYFLEIVTNRGRLNSASLEGTEDEIIMRPQSLREFIRERS